MDNLLEPARRPHRLRQCLSKTAIPVVLALAGLLAPQARAAQEASWPTRQVRIIVPYGPGGIADISARSIAQKMAENTGQPFVVENKPGADTRIGTEYVARMSGDSHILLLGGGGFAVNNALFDKLPYDTASDFIPVGLVVSNPLLLVTGIQQPYANLGELIAAAKNGETITLASGGNGTLSHMSMELLSAAMGAPITHVPYKGGSAHTSDVVGGRVTGIFENPSSALPVLRAGRYKAIAITSAARNPAMPDVPTVAESGAADFEVVNWFGLFAPAGVPEAAVERMAAALTQALQARDLRERFMRDGVAVGGPTTREFGRFVASETEKWAEVVRTRNISVDR